MASLRVQGGSLNFNSLVASSEVTTKGIRKLNSVSGSLRGSLVSHYQMAMSTSIVSSPFNSRNVAFIRVGTVRFISLPSSSRPRLRCSAESVQDDNPKQQDGSPSFGAESVEKLSTAVVAEDREKQNFQRLKDDLQNGMKNFWQNLKEQHVIYKHDRDQWGLGFGPIFTVCIDEDGNRYQVDVSEEEIFRRSGVDPNMAEFADEECVALGQKRIKLAKDHARDIQLGLVTPSPLSIVYQYKREGTSSISSFGNGSSLGTEWNAPGGAPRHFLSFFIPLLSIAFLGMGVKWLFSRKAQNEDPVVQETKLQSMQMRKLKAQMRRQKGTTDSNPPNAQVNGDNRVVNPPITPGGKEVQLPKEVFGEIVEAGQSRVNDEEFQRKVAEIQAMARSTRLREQESAKGRSAQSLQRKTLLEQEERERRRVQRLENLARDLDDVRRLGAEVSDGPDLIPNAVKSAEEETNIPLTPNAVKSAEEETNIPLTPNAVKSTKEETNIPKVEEKAQSSTSQMIGDNYPSELGVDSVLRPESIPLKSNPKSPKSPGVKPRIILSAEEARARIAAKRASSNESSSKPKPRRSKVGFGQLDSEIGRVQSAAMETPNSANSNQLRREENATSLLAQESSEVVSNGVLHTASHGGSPAAEGDSDSRPEAPNMVPTEKTDNVVTPPNELDNGKPIDQEMTRDETKGGGGREKDQGKLKDEEEEMEWMRDDVLREIVFKVQANEEAGREPFHNLNSEQETLFFKGLERKFEREGDDVKKWIKDRVENIDYGSDGISIYDPPESYELRWKEGAARSPKSVYERFSQDRERIINEKRGLLYPSHPDSGEPAPTDSNEESRSPSSPTPTPPSSIAPPSSSETSPQVSKDCEGSHGRPRENISGNSRTKVVVSSSSRTGGGVGPHPSASPSTKIGEAGTGNWAHTKRWSKELERKYAMEKDPATRALMREIGQDLEQWITEEEIEAASRMLDKGIEGEEEYAKMHYERTKEKIKKQREMFGRDAMLSKYSEYKEDVEEVELWWLSLPYVVCIGLRATVEGELKTGLYSVDVTPALDGVSGLSSVPYHTVAFQDRGDAQNFCTLINAQPEKLNVDGAEPVPFDPKDLYKDAKSEGFKVTVIKKGQLQLSVDKPFEEVESQILEVGGARYVDELLSDRVVDMDSVVDDGLGFDRRP